jgi:hypothetical protein
MPAIEPEVLVGMVIGFMTEGTATIGCIYIVRIEGTLEVDAGAKVMWVVTGQLPRRGRRRAVVGATMVALAEGERVMRG